VDGSRSAPKAEADRAAAGLPPFNLVAGTSWFWAAEDRRASVDVLFIDEAGQFSLANALAVAAAAPRLVLLGDPQQLDQVQRGIHPPGTEVSVLEHLAGEGGILPEEQGLFLGETWRMHPRITAFTSELFYEGKLGARGELARQGILVPPGQGSDAGVPAAAGETGQEWRGLHFVEVPHVGNGRESEEEAQAIVALFRELLDREARFADRHGDEHDLAEGDLLVVAPYNAQVARIRRALQAAGYAEARVGTVDRFQGQEAPVAVYSLASSSAADAPRGMDFLFALDRLNVATSRARALTVVVASPALLDARPRHPRQIRMVNGLLRYRELARVW
jgi:superfamily I DNA and/or RNA helicase